MFTPHGPTTRRNPSPPPFVPSGIFPILSLPAELTIQIATYLTPRGIYALLLTSPAFEHLLYVFTTEYRREQVVSEDRAHRYYTPLEYFCSRGVPRVVKRILDTGVNPNETTATPNTNLHTSPLLHAIAFRSSAIVSLLLQHGAHVNHHDEIPRKVMRCPSRGNTPLHFAVGAPHSIPPRRAHDRDGFQARAAELPHILRLLLDAGAEVEARNELRQTPLHVACAAQDGNPQLARMLIANGANVNRNSDLHSHWYEWGVKPIQYAANAGNVQVVRMLLLAHADVDTRTRNGMRPLDLAVLHMRRDMVQVLVDAGADSSAMVGDGTRSLDPFQVVEETATWEEVRAWLGSRGVRGNGQYLGDWWKQGKRPGRAPVRAGAKNEWLKWGHI